MPDLAVGDIVCLQPGNMVPADIRLGESRDRFISRAALIGEALPVEKYRRGCGAIGLCPSP